MRLTLPAILYADTWSPGVRWTAARGGFSVLDACRKNAELSCGVIDIKTVTDNTGPLIGQEALHHCRYDERVRAANDERLTSLAVQAHGFSLAAIGSDDLAKADDGIALGAMKKYASVGDAYASFVNDAPIFVSLGRVGDGPSAIVDAPR